LKSKEGPLKDLSAALCNNFPLSSKAFPMHLGLEEVRHWQQYHNKELKEKVVGEQDEIVDWTVLTEEQQIKKRENSKKEQDAENFANTHLTDACKQYEAHFNKQEIKHVSQQPSGNINNIDSIFSDLGDDLFLG
jgi:hypothetical protein